MKRLLIRGAATELFERIYVFNDENKIIESLGVRLEDLEETVFALLEKYSITEINLSGALVYVRGIEEKLKTPKTATYSVDNLTFHYV